MFNDGEEINEGYETIEHSDDAEFPGDMPADQRGWYICLHDGEGEIYDEIGPFDTKEDAEAAQDLMNFDIAA